MENLGPVLFFVLYILISAWAKRNRKKRFEERSEQYETDEKGDAASGGAGSTISNFFEQLRQELDPKSEGETPPLFMEETPDEYRDLELEREMKPEPKLEDLPVATFEEGSDALEEFQEELKQREIVVDIETDHQPSLAERMAGFTTLEQGMLFKEILGKPRALQGLDKWFHF